MDLPQLGPVAVLLLKSGKSVACPETPSVTLLSVFQGQKAGQEPEKEGSYCMLLDLCQA